MSAVDSHGAWGILPAREVEGWASGIGHGASGMGHDQFPIPNY
ncbi:MULTISPECIES: hypothetical protein [unclassified Microcoleus]